MRRQYAARGASHARTVEIHGHRNYALSARLLRVAILWRERVDVFVQQLRTTDVLLQRVAVPHAAPGQLGSETRAAVRRCCTARAQCAPAVLRPTAPTGRAMRATSQLAGRARQTEHATRARQAKTRKNPTVRSARHQFLVHRALLGQRNQLTTLVGRQKVVQQRHARVERDRFHDVGVDNSALHCRRA